MKEVPETHHTGAPTITVDFICTQRILATASWFFSPGFTRTELNWKLLFALTKQFTLVQHEIVSIKQIREESLPYKFACFWFYLIASQAPREGGQWSFWCLAFFCFYVMPEPGRKRNIIILELLKHHGTTPLTPGTKNLSLWTRKLLFCCLCINFIHFLFIWCVICWNSSRCAAVCSGVLIVCKAALPVTLCCLGTVCISCELPCCPGALGGTASSPISILYSCLLMQRLFLFKQRLRKMLCLLHRFLWEYNIFQSVEASLADIKYQLNKSDANSCWMTLDG